MPKKTPQPTMKTYLSGALTIEKIYQQLQQDFAADGKANVMPSSAFFVDPPAGLGYAGPQEFQASFLNAFVNSKAGKARYNQPRGDDVIVFEIKPTKTVGNLALRIYSDQAK